jgi:hypothetical protein
MRRGCLLLLCSLVFTVAGSLAATRPAAADSDDLPAGSIGAVLGVEAGASGSYTSLGVGVVYGLTAAWQPMSDDQRIGWGVRWSALFGYFPSAAAAPVSGVIRLVEMDLVVRLRIAPTPRPGRYLTIGAGGSLLRTNEPLENGDRIFGGPIATFGYEHNLLGVMLLGVDVRYGIIETGPASIGLLVSLGTAL